MGGLFRDERVVLLEKIDQRLHFLASELRRVPVFTVLFRLAVLVLLGANLWAALDFDRDVEIKARLGDIAEVGGVLAGRLGDLGADLESIDQYVAKVSKTHDNRLTQVGVAVQATEARLREMDEKLADAFEAVASADHDQLEFLRLIDVNADKTLTAVEKIDPMTMSIRLSQIGLSVAGVSEQLKLVDLRLVHLAEQPACDCSQPAPVPLPFPGDSHDPAPTGCQCDGADPTLCDCVSGRDCGCGVLPGEPGGGACRCFEPDTVCCCPKDDCDCLCGCCHRPDQPAPVVAPAPVVRPVEHFDAPRSTRPRRLLRRLFCR
jgi:hypothetical protein